MDNKDTSGYFYHF